MRRCRRRTGENMRNEEMTAPQAPLHRKWPHGPHGLQGLPGPQVPLEAHWGQHVPLPGGGTHATGHAVPRPSGTHPLGPGSLCLFPVSPGASNGPRFSTRVGGSCAAGQDLPHVGGRTETDKQRRGALMPLPGAGRVGNLSVQ
eukprot:gene8514-biopygen3135